MAISVKIEYLEREIQFSSLEHVICTDFIDLYNSLMEISLFSKGCLLVTEGNGKGQQFLSSKDFCSAFPNSVVNGLHDLY